jgi:hypothetical protein
MAGLDSPKRENELAELEVRTVYYLDQHADDSFTVNLDNFVWEPLNPESSMPLEDALTGVVAKLRAKKGTDT